MHPHQPIALDPLFKEAWSLVKGTKSIFLVTFLALIAIEVLIYFLTYGLNYVFSANWIISFFSLLLPALFIAPLLTGLLMIGLKRVRHEHLTWTSGFAYFSMIPQLFIAFVIATIILWAFFIVTGFIAISFLTLLHYKLAFQLTLNTAFILSIFFIALLLAVCKSVLLFNYLLVVDKKESPFTAWWTSIKMTAPHFGKIFFAMLYVILLNALAICLLGIGLIWSIPYSYLIIALLYRECTKH